MIDFDRIEDQELEHGPHCPYCYGGEMELDEHFPDTVVFRCPECHMRALPRQLSDPPAHKSLLGAIASFFALLLIILLAIAFFVR